MAINLSQLEDIIKKTSATNSSAAPLAARGYTPIDKRKEIASNIERQYDLDSEVDTDDSAVYQRAKKLAGIKGLNETVNAHHLEPKTARHQFYSAPRNLHGSEESSLRKREKSHRPALSTIDFAEVGQKMLTLAATRTLDHVGEDAHHEFAAYIVMHPLGKVLLAYLQATSTFRTVNININLQNRLSYN